MSRHDREVFTMSWTPAEWKAVRWDWKFWARPTQLEPPGDWSIWLAMAGRGWGKTKCGAEWVRDNACGPTPESPGRAQRIAMVAETTRDVREVMVAALLRAHPPEFMPRYFKTENRVEWKNGAVALLFSAEEPDQLRGPEHDLAWSDEMAKWRYAQETWDMLQFGLRLGRNPRQLVTTTPRPIPIIVDMLRLHQRELAETGKSSIHVTRGSTFDNSANLSPKYIRGMRAKYEGTRIGRQELEAEILDDAPGALWNRTMFETRSAQFPLAARLAVGEALPDMRRIYVSVDPSGTRGEDDEDSNEIGIVVAGLGEDGLAYVLEDATLSAPPATWARIAVNLYNKWNADAIIAERNYGGAMVKHTIATADRRVPVREVVASRGKVVRAEPVASLYEQGRVRHLGSWAALEDQFCLMTPSGYVGRGSPDRADAAVWALTELMLGRSGEATSRSVRGHH